jgi:hypothetical protein
MQETGPSGFTLYAVYCLVPCMLYAAYSYRTTTIRVNSGDPVPRGE